MDKIKYIGREDPPIRTVPSEITDKLCITRWEFFKLYLCLLRLIWNLTLLVDYCLVDHVP